MSQRDNWRNITIFFVLMFAILTININAPFYGHHEPNGVWIGTSLRNWNWYGVIELGGIPATTAEPVAESDDLYRYVHHPPLMVWLTYGMSKLLGEKPDAMPRELTLRIVSVFSTMLTLSVLYIITRRLIGVRWAMLTTALYSLTPMIAYFGRMPNHEPLAMVFIYCFVAVFINWMRRYTLSRIMCMAVLAVLSMWTAWAGAFFFFSLGLVALLLGTNCHRIAIVVVGIITLVATLGVPAFFEWQYTGSIQELIDAFLYRASSATLAPESVEFTVWGFVVQWFVHMLTSMTYGFVLLAIIGIFWVVRLPSQLVRYTILALWLAPFLYMMTFRNASHVHDYYKIYYLLGFVLAIGVLIKDVWSKPPRTTLQRLSRPLIVGVWITSLVLGVFWLQLLHTTGDDEFLGAIAADVQQLTTTDDLIYSEYERKAGLEYYSYRRWTWDALDDNFADARTEAYFLTCPNENAEAYDGALQSRSYEVIANDACRLIWLGSE